MTERDPPSELRTARAARGWSQAEAARELAALARSRGLPVAAAASLKTLLSRWENGHSLPEQQYRTLLADLYGRQPTELGLGRCGRAGTRRRSSGPRWRPRPPCSVAAFELWRRQLDAGPCARRRAGRRRRGRAGAGPGRAARRDPRAHPGPADQDRGRRAAGRGGRAGRDPGARPDPARPGLAAVRPGPDGRVGGRAAGGRHGRGGRAGRGAGGRRRAGGGRAVAREPPHPDPAADPGPGWPRALAMSRAAVGRPAGQPGGHRRGRAAAAPAAGRPGRRRGTDLPWSWSTCTAGTAERW